MTERRPSQRQQRVAEEIRHILAELFARTSFRDPELATANITVTEVRISPDLRHATAYIARLGRSDAGQLMPALGRVASFLQREVGRRLGLRHTPELSFAPDRALEEAGRIAELLRSPAVARDLGQH